MHATLHRAGKEAGSAPAAAVGAAAEQAAEAAAQQAVAQQAAEQPDSQAAAAAAGGKEEEDEDDENETCGFCRFMKGGGCKAAFTVSAAQGGWPALPRHGQVVCACLHWRC